MPAGRFPPPAAAPKYQTLKANVQLGKGQAVGFRTGKGYYARPAGPTGPSPAAPVDPLQPLTGAEIANRIAGYTATLPAPLTDAQIRARAQGMIDPVIAGLTTRAQAQGRASAGAISGYANSLANSLASYGDSAKSIYGTAEQGQAAADAAESGAIRGTGTELASQLASKLAGLQGPAGLDAATSGQVATAGAGGANATLGTGSAALAQLLARGTAAQNEAALQPGIARSQGLADIRDVTLAGNKTLADEIAAATGQLPGIVSSLRDQSATRQSNRAQAAAQLRQYLEGRNVDLAKYKEAERVAGLTADAKVTAAQTAADARAAAAQTRAAATVQAAKVRAAAAAAKTQTAAATKQAGDTTKQAKARQAAVTSASGTAVSIFGKSSTASVTNPATGEKHKVTIAIGTPAYNAAINQAVAAVSDTLSPYMTHRQIVQYVQAKAKAFFAPPEKPARPDQNPATNPKAAGPPAP